MMAMSIYPGWFASREVLDGRQRTEEVVDRLREADETRERLAFVLDLAERHPGAITSDEGLGAAMMYFSGRL